MWHLLLPLVSAVVVCGCCAVLIVRGVRYQFVMLFGASALIQVLVRLTPALGEQALASLSHTTVRVMEVISGVGIVLFYSRLDFTHSFFARVPPNVS